MNDYKYEMQLLAEEAAERDGKDYFALTDAEQCECFLTGMKEWRGRHLDAADNLRKQRAEAQP